MYNLSDIYHMSRKFTGTKKAPLPESTITRFIPVKMTSAARIQKSASLFFSAVRILTLLHSKTASRQKLITPAYG